MNIGRMSARIAHGLLLACATIVSTPERGEAVAITFDEIKASPTVLLPHDHYEDLGLNLTLIRPNGTRSGFTVVKEPYGGNGAVSNPNSVAFGFARSVLEATFIDPLSGARAVTDEVSFWLGDLSGEADPMTAKFFDVDGVLLGTRRFTSQPTNVLGIQDFGKITFSALAGIHRILISDGSTSGASFDNLIFSAVHNPNGGGGGTEVPEPATLGLLLSGVFGAGMLRKRAQASNKDSFPT